MYLMGFKHEFWFPCLVIILAQRCFLKALCHKIRVTFPGHFLCNHYVTVTFSGRLFWSGRSFKSNCSKSFLGGNFFVVAFFGHFFGRFYGRVSRVKKLAIYSIWWEGQWRIRGGRMLWQNLYKRGRGLKLSLGLCCSRIFFLHFSGLKFCVQGANF